MKILDLNKDIFFNEPKSNNNFVWLNSELQEEYNISYKDIYKYTIYFSNLLEKKGLSRGDYVLLLFETSPHFFIPFLSCLMKNFIPICAYPNNTIQINKILDECNPKVILVSKNYNDLLNSNKSYDEENNDIEYINEQFTFLNEEIKKKKEFLKLSDTELLQIYGYYKQSTIGDININKPSFTNIKSLSKWQAWNSLKGISIIDAKRKYNKLVSCHLTSGNFSNSLYKDMDIIEASIETIINGYKLNNAEYNNEINISINENDTAFIQYSSGSTNNPKGVVISYKNISENIKSILKTVIPSDNESQSLSLLCWLPQYHDMGLVGNYLTGYILSIINTGNPVNLYYMSPMTFLSNGAKLIKYISDKNISFICFPNFAFEIYNSNFNIEDYNNCNLDLSNIHILTGSEKIRINSVRTFINNFSNFGLTEKNIMPCYGLAEYTLMVTINKGLIIHDNNISVGKVTSGSAKKILVINQHTKTICKDGESGEIWIAGDSKATEYFKNEELTNELIKGKLPGDNLEYLKTGDLGYIIDDYLYINGRIKELIIINGKNYYPEDIEDTLNKINPIRKGNNCVVSVEENNTEILVLFAELYTESSKLNFSFVKKEINKHHGITPKYMYILPYDSLPKTSSGKIKRVLLKDLYLNDKLQFIEKLDDNSIDKNVNISNIDQRILKDFGFLFCEFEYNDETKGVKLSQLGVTSLVIAMIYQKINVLVEKYRHNNKNNIKFSISYCFDLSYEDLYDLLLKLYNDEPFFIGGKNKDDHLSGTLRLMHEDIIIQPDDLPKFNKYGLKLSDNNCNVFITGITGFLGSFLLYDLLTRTTSKIYAHVRCKDKDHGYTRMIDIMKKFKLLNNEIKEQIDNRVIIIQGDLELPLLGLTQDVYDFLCENIDVIFHSGAGVNYIQPYESLRGSHVFSTREIVLMCFNKKQKTLHHMSSSTTCGFFDAEKHPVLYESQVNLTGDNINFGYGQGKWAAEMIVYNAIKLGLKCKIYRPSFLTADSLNYVYHEQDIIIKIFELMLDHKKTFYGDYYLNCIPVDIAATNIISLSLMDDFYSNIFHITTDLKKNIDNTEYQYKLLGNFFFIPIEFMMLEDFVEYINKTIKPDESFYPLLPFFNDHYENIAKTAGKIYDNSFCKSCFNKYPEFEYKFSSNKDTIIYICKYLMNKPKFGLLNIFKNYIKNRTTHFWFINVFLIGVLCYYFKKFY